MCSSVYALYISACGARTLFVYVLLKQVAAVLTFLDPGNIRGNSHSEGATAPALLLHVIADLPLTFALCTYWTAELSSDEETVDAQYAYTYRYILLDQLHSLAVQTLYAHSNPGSGAWYTFVLPSSVLLSVVFDPTAKNSFTVLVD